MKKLEVKLPLVRSFDVPTVIRLAMKRRLAIKSTERIMLARSLILLEQEPRLQVSAQFVILVILVWT